MYSAAEQLWLKKKKVTEKYQNSISLLQPFTRHLQQRGSGILMLADLRPRRTNNYTAFLPV